MCGCVCFRLRHPLNNRHNDSGRVDPPNQCCSKHNPAKTPHREHNRSQNCSTGPAQTPSAHTPKHNDRPRRTRSPCHKKCAHRESTTLASHCLHRHTAEQATHTACRGCARGCACGCGCDCACGGRGCGRAYGCGCDYAPLSQMCFAYEVQMTFAFGMQGHRNV